MILSGHKQHKQLILIHWGRHFLTNETRTQEDQSAIIASDIFSQNYFWDNRELSRTILGYQEQNKCLQ